MECSNINRTRAGNAHTAVNCFGLASY